MQIRFTSEQPTEAQTLCDILSQKSDNKIRSLNDIAEISMTGHELLGIVRTYITVRHELLKGRTQVVCADL